MVVGISVNNPPATESVVLAGMILLREVVVTGKEEKGRGDDMWFSEWRLVFLSAAAIVRLQRSMQ